MPISKITNKGLGAGAVLQVVQAFKSDTFSHNSTSWTPITGLSVDITPTSATSKILVMFSVGGTASSDGYAASLKIVRNASTSIGVGDAAGSRVQATAKFHGNSISHTYFTSAQYLDSPNTTSSTNYRIEIAAQSGGLLYVNRTGADANSTDPYHARSTSVITVMEIAA